MLGSPVATITRRDVRDAFSDWRILIPLVVLAIFLPLILLQGIRIATSFLNEAELTRNLVPLGLLIAGFLPASFSLIGPLEAFVGEKERNTLEALLAAPISDRGLYIGKFVASLLPPIISSTIAMALYAGAAMLSRRADIAAAMTVNWVLLIVIVVYVKALAMVAAAVYVSSHTTSIRAANLLASFILIPMGFVVQAEALFFINNVLWPIALITLILVGIAVVFVVGGVRSFNREAILAREQRSSGASHGMLRGGISQRRYGAVINVARREVRDTLTDWRILIPIMVLTVLMPLLAVGGAMIALKQLGDDSSGILSLMPFLFLLVGFLPASFSLITALEVFVGEKERGTLESLFSMPISDNEVYRGKFLSALLPPVSSGIVAMVLFYGGLWVLGQDQLLSPLTPPILLGMLALSVVQAITMVAGAVIISSHTSSVRVANLLASFILLPITVIVQIEAVFIIANRYDVIRLIGLMMIPTALLLLRSGMQSFSRESILSREHLALNWGAVIGAFAAFFREIRPAGVDPDQLAAKLSLRRFYRRELPVVWREIRWPLLAVGISVLAGVIFGTIYDPEHRTQIMRLLVPTENIGTIPVVHPAISLAIFARNSWSIFITGLLSAVSFGLFALLVPLIAFFSVSYGATWAAHHAVTGGAFGFVLAYALPHGIIELPTALLAAALGLRVGASVVSVPATYSVGRHLLWSLALYLKMFVFVLLPLLLLAALIEGTLTPLVARAVYGG